MMRDNLQLYIATYWNGTDWLDLHDEPEPFKTASDIAYLALLSGKETTRLRQVVSLPRQIAVPSKNLKELNCLGH